MPKPDVEISMEFLEQMLKMVKDPRQRQEISDFINYYIQHLENGTILDATPPEFFRRGLRMFDVGVGMIASHLSMASQYYGMYAYIHRGLGEAIARALETDFGDSGTYLEIMAGTGWLAKAAVPV